jgi:hypothetical protein
MTGTDRKVAVRPRSQSVAREGEPQSAASGREAKIRSMRAPDLAVVGN